jgi:serine/threonine protein kinase
MQFVVTQTDMRTQSSSALHIGNYTLLRQLGQGEFATIYLAEHFSSKKRVALKLLHQARSNQEEVERFQLEATLLTQLRHRHIVRAFDFGWEQDTPFLTMAYATGGTLREVFDQKAPLPISNILPTVLQLASALRYVHNRHIIHGDVKPENVLIGPHNEIWLGDFGVATASSALETASRKRPVIGTARYMAPEQIQGYPLPASDQYALAAMVYEWLCGQPLFRGSALEVQVRHITTPPPRLSDRAPLISSAIEHVVLKALEKDPHKRFANVTDFAAALKEAASHRPLFSCSQQPSGLCYPQVIFHNVSSALCKVTSGPLHLDARRLTTNMTQAIQRPEKPVLLSRS